MNAEIGKKMRFCKFLSVMVWFVVQYGKPPVNLFQEKNPDHLVGKGHPGKRDGLRSPFAKLAGKPVGPADGKHEATDSPITFSTDIRGKTRRREPFTSLIEQDQPTVLRQRLHQPGALGFASRFGLRPLFLFHLADLQRHIAYDPGRIFLDPATYPLLLGLADPEDL